MTKKLTEVEAAKVAALRGMGRTEQQALDWLAKEEREQQKPKPAQLPTERRQLRDSAGKRTVYLMTATQSATFDMLRGYGKTDREALELVERQAGGKFVDDEARRRELRRQAFAGLSFTPAKRLDSMVRTLNAHNAGQSHDRKCCPACCSRAG